ncbi:MAG: DUF4389 domain-containing protein [Chloroflexota bacterium]|nr:DUF4389 domain-containing protein [Chloroflexota bacterium]
MATHVPTFEQVPIRIEFDYPERMSRWLLWFKWLLIIPHQIVLSFYGVAVYVTTFIAWWAILFTGRYPQGLFDFAVGYMRWTLRVSAYFPLLMTDRYPPFGSGDHTVRYEADYPQSLSRGVLLLRFFMAVPVSPFFWLALLASYVLFFLVFSLVYAAIAWIWLCVLCTGKYPRGLYNFVAAVAGWQHRATAWWFLLRDDWSLFGAQGVRVVEAPAAS